MLLALPQELLAMLLVAPRSPARAMKARKRTGSEQQLRDERSDDCQYSCGIERLGSVF